MKIAISGGGTGGHIYPALALVRELKKTIPTPNFYISAQKRDWKIKSSRAKGSHLKQLTSPDSNVLYQWRISKRSCVFSKESKKANNC